MMSKSINPTRRHLPRSDSDLAYLNFSPSYFNLNFNAFEFFKN